MRVPDGALGDLGQSARSCVITVFNRVEEPVDSCLVMAQGPLIDCVMSTTVKVRRFCYRGLIKIQQGNLPTRDQIDMGKIEHINSSMFQPPVCLKSCRAPKIKIHLHLYCLC